MTKLREDALAMSPAHVDTSEEIAKAAALAKQWADARPDNSKAIAAMVRKISDLAPAESPPAHETETSQDSRPRLRSAIEARNKAHDAFTKAANAAAKAGKMLRQAEADLAALGDVDAAIAAHRASLIRDEIDGSSAATLELPPELAEREHARAEVTRRIEAIGSARAQLEAELDDARQRLASAEMAVERFAQAVLRDQAVVLAAELGNARAHLCTLYDSLNALANLWLAGQGQGGAAMGPLKLPNGPLTELERCSGLANKRRASGVAPDWQGAYNALLQDADHALPGEPQP